MSDPIHDHACEALRGVAVGVVDADRRCGRGDAAGDGRKGEGAGGGAADVPDWGGLLVYTTESRRKYMYQEEVLMLSEVSRF